MQSPVMFVSEKKQANRQIWEQKYQCTSFTCDQHKVPVVKNTVSAQRAFSMMSYFLGQDNRKFSMQTYIIASIDKSMI